jgi:hypothetical protein
MVHRPSGHRNTHSGHTEPHSEPQRWLPAQCTIERETDRLSLYRWHRLRLYHGTHPQRAQEHPQRAHRAGQTASAMATGTMYHRARDRPPQPLPWYTPTIGQPTASRTDPHRHALRLYAMRAHTPSGTHTDRTGHALRLYHGTHPQRAHRASQTASAMATGTMYHTHHRTAYSEPHRSTQTASSGARIYTASRNARTGRARAQCTHHRGEIPPAPPYCVLYILTDLYKYRSVYTYTRVCMRAYI